MAKIVVDTNVHLSYLLSRAKSNAVAVALGLVYSFHTPVQSAETFAELEDVVFRPKFDRYLQGADRQAFLDAIRARSLFVYDVEPLKISRDPKDDIFFALAKASNADIILSGDKKDVLSIPEFKSTPLSPHEFINPENDLARRLHDEAGYHGFKKKKLNAIMDEILRPDGIFS